MHILNYCKIGRPSLFQLRTVSEWVFLGGRNMAKHTYQPKTLALIIIDIQDQRMQKKDQGIQILNLENQAQSESSEFLLEEKKPQKVKKYTKWIKSENQAYARFLQANFQEFKEQGNRRSQKFFNKMSEELGIGRNNEKCRSHHQKMLFRYKTVENIIKGILHGKKIKSIRKKTRKQQESGVPTEFPKTNQYFQQNLPSKTNQNISLPQLDDEIELKSMTSLEKREEFMGQIDNGLFNVLIQENYYV